MLKKEYLFSFDFDGTLADTFTPSPNNIGVNEAYRLAVKKVFGREGLAVYNKIGGLQNRSPMELVCNLLDFEERLILEIEEGIPIGDNFFSEIAEMIVREKLSSLLGEIDERWPLPFPRALKTLEVISNLLASIAVLSSGHEQFITKTFEIWNLSRPNFLVTEDDIRWRKYPANVYKRVKPATFPFAILHQRWLKKMAVNNSNLLLAAKESRQRVVYFGDDPIKDGGLACNVGVPFGWFNSNGKKDSHYFPEGSFIFSDWNQVAEFLCKPNIQKLFRKGISCSKIFSYF